MIQMRRAVRAVFGVTGPCSVCGHEADSVVVYGDGREVFHANGDPAPCPLPNPPQKTEGQS